MKKRDLTIDLMKGIAILAVFVGHFSILPPLHLQRFAFSFRMPLLIMIGGWFFKTKNTKEQLKNDWKRLFLPFIISQFAYCVLLRLSGGDVSFMDFIASIYGNAVKPDFQTFLQGTIPCVGILWFLPGIFWCRIIYNLLFKIQDNEHILSLVVFIISLLTIYSCKYLILPFGISHGLSMLVFYHIGHLLRNHMNRSFNTVIFIGSFVLWMLSFVFARFSVGEFYYEMLLLNLVGTSGAFYCIYFISKALAKHHVLYPLIWCGQNSMAIYCFHAICLGVCFVISGQPYVWAPYDAHIMFIIHIVFCLLLTFISSKFSWTKKLYGIVDFKYEKSSFCKSAF